MDLAAAMQALTPERLREKGSLKWTAGRPGELGAFVAESDVPLAPAVVEALHDVIARGVTGYLPGWLDADAAASAARFQQRRFGWDLGDATVGLLPDVLTCLAFTATRLVPDGPLVLPTPAYMPFLVQPGLLGRELRTVPMDRTDGRYRLDPDRLRSALADGGVLLLVNPHNPTGQVATRGELLDIADVVESTGATVFADEIHSPLVYPGATHLPYASLDERTAAHSVTAVSASKGWNLPGLACAQLIMTADNHRRRWDELSFVAKHGVSPLGAAATVAAYDRGIDHLDRAVSYLQAFRDLFAAELLAALPAVGYCRPEATYLHWLDLRPLGVNPAEVRRRTGVFGTDGRDCGAEGHVRLSLATTHAIIAEMARRLGTLAN